jgi:hypothetical protein
MIDVDSFRRTVGPVDSDSGRAYADTRFTAHHHAYEYLSGRPTVGRTLYVDQTPGFNPTVITIDWGRADADGPSHTFTSSFNLNATGTITQPAAGVINQTLTKFYSLRTQTLLVAGQTAALTDTFVSNSPPPDAKSPAKHYAVSQTGTNAVFVTLYTVYVSHWNPSPEHNGQNPPPPSSIAWGDGVAPQPGHAVKIRLTLPDGTVRLLTFNPPDLSPMTVISGSPAPASAFDTTRAIEHDNVFDLPDMLL